MSRILVVEDSPDIRELVRVTKPGGRVVVVDTDWGMHAIHGADPRLTSRVVECWATNAANGWSYEFGYWSDLQLKSDVKTAAK